jgi:hypothetical protein
MALTEKELKAKEMAKSYFFPHTGIMAMAMSSSAAGTAAYAPTPNVVGIGIGPKVVKGQDVVVGASVQVYVRVKVPARQLKTPFLAPSEFNGLPTDVVEVGDVEALQTLSTGQRFGLHRPTSCGVSVGHSKNVAVGTLGCLVQKDNTHYILSNNHVLADCNGATKANAVAGMPGDGIIQPGVRDGGVKSRDGIAILSDFKDIDFAGQRNDIDAAIAEVGPDTQTIIEPEIIDIGRPQQTTKAASTYQSVRKHGRTTGHTIGIIMATDVNLWVGYPCGRAWFEDQILITGIGPTAFALPGDSGSLIVDAVTREPVALLFAGGKSYTFANPIDIVLSHFQVGVV